MGKKALEELVFHDDFMFAATIRHGRFTIIVEQRNYGLNKAKGKDALLRELFFSYSVQDTMTVMHF